MRFCQGLLLIIVAVSSIASAQTNQKRVNLRQQTSSGIAWAQQAMLALTGGNPVGSVTESGTVTRTVGSDQQQGSLTLQSSGVMTNQISLSLTRGTLAETRTWNNGDPGGSWTGFDGVRHPMALHNCWTDAVWFFPALSLLSDYADPNLVFADLGQQQYNGGSVEHIQVYRTASGLDPNDLQLLAHLSTVDYYLDSQTALPVAIAFATHPDTDFTVGIPVMAVYTNYTAINGIQTPLQITRSLNGTIMLQVSISSASPNH